MGRDCGGTFLAYICAQLLLLSIAASPLQAAEILISGSNTGHQSQVQVAANNNGDIVTGWRDIQYKPDDSIDSVKMVIRLFDRTGTPQTGEIIVDSFDPALTTEDGTITSLAMDENGNFVVIWDLYDSGDGDYDVFAQRYDQTGTAVGSAFMVHESANLEQRFSKAAMDAAGNFVVIWKEWTPPATHHIRARLFDSSGTPQGASFQIDQGSVIAQYPAVAMNPAGDFVVTWTSEGSSLGDIMARRFDTNGLPVSDGFIVNTYTDFDQRLSSVSLDSAGNFVITWEGHPGFPSPDQYVYFQRFDSQGNPLGNETNPATIQIISNNFPQIASDIYGNFMLIWESEGFQGANSTETVGRLYSSGGTPITQQENKINQSDYRAQSGGSVAAAGNGAFAVVWTSWHDLDNAPDVYLSIEQGGVPLCADIDGDGYGNGPECAGYDCNDFNPDINAGQDEICNDGLDNNCNGDIDLDDLFCNAPPTYFVDNQNISCDDTGPGSDTTPFCTIGQGIAAASVGETVLVRDGTYQENPVLSKTITLRSENGATTTIIDGGSSNSVLRVGGGPIIQGFTMQNGSAAKGGGMNFSGGSTALVADCIIRNNRATDIFSPYGVGGGLYLVSASPTFKNVTISENSAADGGGVYLDTAAHPDFENTLINNNTAGRGGGIYSTSSTFNLLQSSITDNTTSQDGAGIYAFNTNASGQSLIEQSRISNNHISTSGSTYRGTAMYLDRSSPSLVNTIVSNNGDLNYGRDAVYCTTDADIMVESSTFHNNYYSAIYFSSSAPTVTNSIIWSNVGTGIAGYPEAAASYSDIIHFDPVYPGTGNINTDPQLADDSRLTPASPCIDAGTGINAPASDIDGENRPQGAGYDMGADEFSLPPAILAQNPIVDALNIPVDSILSVTFNRALDNATLPGNFLLSAGGIGVPGTIGLDGTKTLTFTPAAPLTHNTTYTATITTGVHDIYGNGLAGDYSWNFTTRLPPPPPPDTTPPTIVAADPIPASAGNPVNSTVTLTFDEDIDPATLDTNSFYLERFDYLTGMFVSIPGSVSYDPPSYTAMFTPAADLPYSQYIYYYITNNVTDPAGNPLDNTGYTFNYFQVECAPSAPGVVSTIPVADAVNVPLDATVTVTFDTDMDPGTITTSTFVLAQQEGYVQIPGAVSYDAGTKTATLTPSEPLPAGKVLYFNASLGITDLSGVSMCNNYVSYFTTTSGATCIDSDGDGYGDPGHPENTCPVDNCPDDFNPGQDDLDLDGAGDVCDDDIDGDCLPNINEPLCDPPAPVDCCVYDGDCDDDGLPDGTCSPGEDLNNNGIVDFGETDPMNPDSDGDGILDGTEYGLTAPVKPEFTDMSVFVPDADPTTTTDPTNPDTDGDGISDGVEDGNHNGQVEPGLGETNPACNEAALGRSDLDPIPDQDVDGYDLGLFIEDLASGANSVTPDEFARDFGVSCQ